MQNPIDDNGTKTQTKKLTCKLTEPELRVRKATILANLKKQVLLIRELKNGFAYRFSGSDSIVDQLTTFVIKKVPVVIFSDLLFQLAVIRAMRS